MGKEKEIKILRHNTEVNKLANIFKGAEGRRWDIGFVAILLHFVSKVS